jgi:acyl-CoA dehydrogenase
VAAPIPEPAPVISATFPRILPAMTLLAAEDTIGHPTTPEGAVMDFEYSKKTKMYMEQLTDFMNKYIYPSEHVFHEQLDSQPNRWQIPPIMEELKEKARERGLWNLFLPESHRGAGLTNLEYAPLCEVMGRSHIAPEVFNCSAPDTGNMEVFERYGTEEHKKQYLEPLLAGKIRSAFAMTEPKVASSDATNIESSIARDGDAYVINGHKWWTSGIGDPRCKVLIFMGKTDPKNPDKYKQQSMIVVPRDTPGITVKRMLTVFGYDDAPHGHGEVLFENVRVPASNLLLGEGRGFEIAQGRLGPGRIHHCMRQIGVAERALELMCKRSMSRVAFGKRIAEHDVTLERLAEARIRIDQARLLVLHAAYTMDTVGNKAAKQAIAEIKVAVPNMTGQVVDWAMQVHGGGGVSQEFPLAFMWAHSRTLRFADGPDEVHRRQIGRLELRKHS